MELKKTQIVAILNYAEGLGIDKSLLVYEYKNKNKAQSSFFRKLLMGIEDLPNSTIRVKNTSYCFSFTTSLDKGTRSMSTSYFRSKRIQWLSEEHKWIVGGDILLYNVIVETSFSPSLNFTTENQTLIGNKSTFKWEDLFLIFKIWLLLLAEELKAKDILDRIGQIPSFMVEKEEDGAATDDFSNEERFVLKSGIEQLKTEIEENVNIPEDDLTLVMQKLEELTEKVDHLSKFDAKSALYGLLVNLASSVLYDQAPAFWGIVKGIFGKEALVSAKDLIA